MECQEPCVCDRYCDNNKETVLFNTPARRKFLKSDSVGFPGTPVREFERMALVNNHIRIGLDTGTRTVDLRAGSFKQRIIGLWKSGLDNQLLPINVETSLVKIRGFCFPSGICKTGIRSSFL